MEKISPEVPAASLEFPTILGVLVYELGQSRSAISIQQLKSNIRVEVSDLEVDTVVAHRDTELVGGLSC